MIPSDKKSVCNHSDTHVTVKACQPLDRFSIAPLEFQILKPPWVMKTINFEDFFSRIVLSHIKLQNIIFVYRMSKNALNNC